MSTAGIRALLPTFLQDRITQVLASPIGGRLARGAFWSLIGSLLSKAFTTICWVVVGRLLGKEGFGELNMVQSTIGLFSTAAGMCMGIAAAKYVAEYRTSDPERAGRFIALASATTWVATGIFAAVLVVLAPWLARETLHAPHLTPALVVSALVLIFTGVSGAQSGTLTGLESFKAIASINVIVGLATFPILLAGAAWGGVVGGVWGLAAAAALNCVLNLYYLRKQLKQHAITIRYKGCLRESAVFWHFNLPGIINTLFGAGTTWAVGAILVHHSNGFGDLGVYNAVQRIKLIPENIAAMLLAPMLPILSEVFSRKDHTAYGKTLRLSYVVATLTLIPIALVQIAYPAITLLPYGSEYEGGQPVVMWSMLATITYALLWPMGNIFVSMGLIRFAFIVGMLHSGLTLGLAWLLIPQYGATGLAMGAALALILANIPCIVLLQREFPTLLRDARWHSMTGITLALFISCQAAATFLTPLIALATGCTAAVVFLVWQTMPLLGRKERTTATS